MHKCHNSIEKKCLSLSFCQLSVHTLFNALVDTDKTQHTVRHRSKNALIRLKTTRQRMTTITNMPCVSSRSALSLYTDFVVNKKCYPVIPLQRGRKRRANGGENTHNN